MLKLLCVVLSFGSGFTWLSNNDERLDFLTVETRRSDTTFNLNQTFFPSLDNYQVEAVPTSETKYPWIARVVHSREADIPHVCTAVCIDKGIFITAARCIFSLKVTYTTVIYKNTRLPTRAFVIPSNGTKQAFDDIGFIVVENVYHGVWDTIDLFDESNRTDEGFEWFANLGLRYGRRYEPIEYKVVGYSVPKGIHKIKSAHIKFELTELQVFINIDMCSTILTFNHLIKGFRVPCYHSCDLQQFKYKDATCNKYQGVEGGAVIDSTRNKLMGVATWGAYFSQYELPAGFAVPNSENFFNDYECAKRIRNDNGLLIDISYQSLCEET